MKTQAKIFTVLEFRKREDEIENRVHYVAAESSADAEVIFKEDFGIVSEGYMPHFYILTDGAVKRSEESNCFKRCVFYVDGRYSPLMNEAEYEAWKRSQTRPYTNCDGEAFPAVYRRIN